MRNFDVDPGVALVPAMPEPGTLMVPEQIEARGDALVRWADATDDLDAVRKAVAGWAAITEYVQRTSSDGVAAAKATMLRLEARVGKLLGPAAVGSHHSIAVEGAQDLTADQRSQFRRMAEHPEAMETVIALSTDQDPPSRAKVLREIRQPQARPSKPKARSRGMTLSNRLRGVDAKPVQVAIKVFTERLTKLGIIDNADAFRADVESLVTEAHARMRSRRVITVVPVDPYPPAGDPPGWEALRDYVITEVEQRFGPWPRDEAKEAWILHDFVVRWGDDAERIARSAFRDYGGYWRSAPVTVSRFGRGSDAFFAEVVANSLRDPSSGSSGEIT